MGTIVVADYKAREAALDVRYSYAIQAPAGSGKTELLSLRFLKLLALCKQPEEVLAITFTRKAAAEMAHRILDTLLWANSTDLPNGHGSTDIEKQKHAAAIAVLNRDKHFSWQLLDTPARLRIQTIDSFCHQLSARLPLLSGLGATSKVSAQVDDCMQEAVMETLALLDSKHTLSTAIEKLLRHFDNNTAQVEALLVSLLYKRNQWVSLLGNARKSGGQAITLNTVLEKNITELVQESLHEANACFSAVEYRLAPLLAFAGSNLKTAGSDSTLVEFCGIEQLPTSHYDALALWKSIATLLTTRSGSKVNWRKSFTKNNGFPAPSSGTNAELKAHYKANKDAIAALVRDLSNSEKVLHVLEKIHYLPDYSSVVDNSKYPLLGVLTEIAPTLLAYLQLAFARHRKVDYEQISQAALQSLGSDELPTDIALALDNQLQHILVDEFQDTSSLQFSLLEKLTAAWSPDDGRTLFVVGDAMQSCYGFRSANVGLFIRAREQGIGSVALKPLDLKTNFRSTGGVVSWLNNAFSHAFPKDNDISLGAVSYSTSEAFHQADAIDAITNKFIVCDSDTLVPARQQEALEIVKRIQHLRGEVASDSIAILVRNRSHLTAILPELRAANIPWTASEIDPLVAFPAIQDLLVLLRTLHNKADHLSWYALLRAPWCGLTLDQLLQLNKALAENEYSLALLMQGRHFELQQWLCNLALDESSQRRIEHLAQVMAFAEHYASESTVVDLLRISWEQLGGNSLYREETEQAAISRFFTLLEQQQRNGRLSDITDFEANVASTFVSSASSEIVSDYDPVSIMTIHKAKGLEFDHLIVAGLDRRPRVDDSALLIWHQRLNSAGQPKLLLATKAASGEKASSLYEFIRHEQTQKTLFENTRLLYIAISRAKKTALLTAVVQSKSTDEKSSSELKPPTPASLLYRIWDALELMGKIEDSNCITVTQNTGSSKKPMQTESLEGTQVSRLTLSEIDKLQHYYEPLRCKLIDGDSDGKQQAVSDPADTANIAAMAWDAAEISPSFAKDSGIVIHRAIQYLADQSITDVIVIKDTLPQLLPLWRRQLTQTGGTIKQIEMACEFISQSVIKVFGSSQCNWIFSEQLTDAQNEFALQSVQNGRLHTHIVDRTFVDSENTRWIIDYKSTQHTEQNQDLQSQLLAYKPQLERYRNLFSKLETRNIKTAVLFTHIAEIFELD